MKVEQIKDMPRKDVFRLLNLETAKIKQFQMIENLDCNGRIVE